MYIYFYTYVYGCHMYENISRERKKKKKGLVTMLALVGANMGVPLSDPYNGNGLSDGYANLLGCSNNNR